MLKVLVFTFLVPELKVHEVSGVPTTNAFRVKGTKTDLSVFFHF